MAVDWDPDVAAALEDDFNFDQETELEDDFILKANTSGDDDETFDDGFTLAQMMRERLQRYAKKCTNPIWGNDNVYREQ